MQTQNAPARHVCCVAGLRQPCRCVLQREYPSWLSRNAMSIQYIFYFNYVSEQLISSGCILPCHRRWPLLPCIIIFLSPGKFSCSLCFGDRTRGTRSDVKMYFLEVTFLMTGQMTLDDKSLWPHWVSLDAHATQVEVLLHQRSIVYSYGARGQLHGSLPFILIFIFSTAIKGCTATTSSDKKKSKDCSRLYLGLGQQLITLKKLLMRSNHASKFVMIDLNAHELILETGPYWFIFNKTYKNNHRYSITK